ncbi:acyl carrier protein [Streptomyces griseorubiginosus]|uniref:acyl carrier protein n=1 Tax=Streptomyces griseorubiginosus TaxID=67304 RepID=UPI001AD622E0|nr:acyl carrier protein [Streptomyces griseorubiginosus]MBO4254977.1 acyl carrier protein [Streptomyces griseorubiginosus]
MPESDVEIHSAQSLVRWLTECVAMHLARPADTIDASVPLSDYGLDSVYALSVIAELEDHLDVSLDPAIMWDNPTIDALSKALAEELALNG